MNIDQLADALAELERRGWITSLRAGNTGIGYTLESLLNVQENNIAAPDIGDVELKSQRHGATSRITLFTFNRGVWGIHPSEVINRYGYIDNNGRPSLYSTVSVSANSLGFYVRVENESLKLRHVDGKALAEWDGNTLIGRFSEKMPALITVYAESRENSEGKEEFWFNEAWYLSNPNAGNFMELIRGEKVVVDIRMHMRHNGQVRNHGTGFRIEERFLNLCFENRMRLV